MPLVQAQFRALVKPGAHQLRIAIRLDPTTVFGQKSALGNDIEPGKQCQPFIKNRTHDMRRSSVAEQFQSQQRAPGVRGRDLRGAGQASLFQHPVERKAGQVGKKQKDAAKFGSQAVWGEI